PVSCEPTPIEHAPIHALAVIPNSQPKLGFVVADFDFDSPRRGMPACIAKRLGCNSVNLVSEDRIELSRRAFHLDMEVRTIRAGFIVREFFCQRRYGSA